MSKKKIGILTHPLINNYGGILQTFALQTYLQNFDFEVVILDRRNNRGVIKRLALAMLNAIPFTPYWKARIRVRKLTSFINTHIHRTKAIYSDWEFKKVCDKNIFDVIVVGSDQVWRADFASPRGGLYFLDFIPKNSKTKKIAYAASLGYDDWRYTFETTIKIQEWVSDFIAVSVREESAVKLCKENMHVDATHVLDPTFLLPVTEYDKLASTRLVIGKYIFVYWLGDRESLRKAILPFINKGYTIIEQSLRGNNIQMSIEDWLSYIKYADRVITDSFHGCVFSLIFHKQFIIHANQSGGTTRLASLFKMLNIEGIFNNSDYMIDYIALDNTLITLRNFSKEFLFKALEI